MIKTSVLFFPLIIIGLVILTGIVVAIVLGARNRTVTSSPLEPLISHDQRVQTLQQKKDRYVEERGRILAMVDEGKLTADDADRLFESLERETTTMACPYCAEEIRVEAAKCKHCNQFLVDTPQSKPRLTKSSSPVVSGVCGGLAEHLDLDPTLVRVAAALVILFTGILTGLIVYVVAACIMPKPDHLAV